MQQNCLQVGTHLMAGLSKLRDKYDIIGDVRGKGLQIGVEMVKDKVPILPNTWLLTLLCNVCTCVPGMWSPSYTFATAEVDLYQ